MSSLCKRRVKAKADLEEVGLASPVAAHEAPWARGGKTFKRTILCLLLLLVVVPGIAFFGLSAASGPLPDPGVPDVMTQIPSVDFRDLSFHRFYKEFREQDRPLIIKGVPPEQRQCFGGLGVFHESILDNCSGEVRVYRQVAGTAVRKACLQVDTTSYSDFTRLFREPGAIERRYGAGHYFAHGSAVSKACPHLWRHIRIPAYVTGQALLHEGPRPSQGSGNIDLYFSLKGMSQSYHVDVPMSELWTHVCRGRKYYRVVPRSVASRWLGWGAVAHRTLLLRPAAWPTGMPVFHGEAGPEDVVYLPAGSMHAVSNLEDTINIVNDAVDVGGLVPTSWVNEKVFRGACWWSRPTWLGLCYPNQLNWMTDSSRRTPVHDGAGRVLDAAATPRGFPSWGQLTEWGLPPPR